MNVYINGQTIVVDHQHATVWQALQQYLTKEQQQQSFAIALNGDFVSKNNYQSTALKTGDAIDILFPIQGG